MAEDMSDSTPPHTHRRRILQMIGALGVTGLAGCGGDGDSNGGTSTDEPTSTPTVTEPVRTATEPTSTPPPVGGRVETAGSERRWSDPETWSGSIPREGENVTVPAGETVLLDTDPPELSRLTVEGHLRFAREDRSLRAGSVVVTNNGRLTIGTESNPFLADATITLVGERSGESSQLDKSLAAHAGGTIEIHGAAREQTDWCQLGETAPAGATEITVDTAVDWAAGDDIAIAPSGFDPYDAERHTVAGVSGRTVELERPLEHCHYGEHQTYDHDGETVTVDERAEVGLLTRNVTIQGDEDSARKPSHRGGDHPPVGEYAPGFGGHCHFHHSDRIRIEGVEFQRMGQTGVLGRYPVHWHKGTGDRPADYLRHCSVNHSFQKGVVTHGTGKVRVEGNVVFDVINDAYTPAEEGLGSEEGNQYVDNLAILTRNRKPSDAIGQNTPGHSHGAAGFWLTNMNNVLRGNHSAGVDQGHGFFYQIKGAAQYDRTPERKAPVFEDNVAHSTFENAFGNDVYPEDAQGHGLFLRNVSLIDGDEPVSNVEKVFRGYTAYKNTHGGVWAEHETEVIGDSVLADNGAAVLDQSGVTLRDTLVVGRTDNDIGKPPTDHGGTQIHTYTGINSPSHGRPNPTLETVTFVDCAYAAVDLNARFEGGGGATGVTCVRTNPLRFGVDDDLNVAGAAYADADGSLVGTGTPGRFYHPDTAPEPDWTYVPDAQAYYASDASGRPEVGIDPDSFVAHHSFEAQSGLGGVEGRGWAGTPEGHATIDWNDEPLTRPVGESTGSSRAVLFPDEGEPERFARPATLDVAEPAMLARIRTEDDPDVVALAGETVVETVSGGDGWTDVVVDLSAYAGETVPVGLERRSSGDLYLDELLIATDSALASYERPPVGNQ